MIPWWVGLIIIAVTVAVAVFLKIVERRLWKNYCNLEKQMWQKLYSNTSNTETIDEKHYSVNIDIPDDVKQLLTSPEYDFMLKDPHLGNRICLLSLGGSKAYGTNIAGSDTDIRGTAMEFPEEIIGMKTFEQYENKATDTKLYSFNKMVKLLCQANPNIIEILGCKDYIYVSPLGQILLDNRNLFITKKVAGSFSGYAKAQLAKIKNAMFGDALSEEEKKQHELNAINNAMESFEEHYPDYIDDDENYFNIYIDSKGDNPELFSDIHFKHFPLNEFKGMVKEIKNVTDDYDKIGNRNTKIDDAHMCKHMMHLVRLYHMGIEILLTGEVNTYRESDHELLMDIRNGKYMDMEKHIATPEFFELCDQLEKELKEAIEKSELPKHPDYDKVNALLVKVNQDIVNGVYDNNGFVEFVESLKASK